MQQSTPKTIYAGVLSDTHLHTPTSAFLKEIRICFHHCDVIIHAGDLTGPDVLKAFSPKTVHAVHGNMCETSVRHQLPAHHMFTLGRFTIGLAHGAHLGADIETSLWNLFPEADCIIYGHTHSPVCHRFGSTLFLNPGTFRATGQYGAPGTYAILEAGEQLSARLMEVPRLP
ncbi:MAG: metallophosphoesterase family protein [Desulfobulbus sp.]|nr:metallophosphoesterase family protein [Desulfobulbus sp.]